MNISPATKINVMHLTNNIGYASSVECLILMSAEGIDKSRFNMSVTSLTEPERVSAAFVENAKKVASHVHLIPWKKSKPFITAVRQLVGLIRKYEIDVLHTHEVRTNFVGLIAARLSGIKVIASVHGWVWDTVPLLWKLYQHVDSRVIRFFDHIVVGSDFLRNDIIKRGMPPVKITTIHNAVDTASLDLSVCPQDFKRKYNLKSTNRVVATVGRLSKEKGHRYLLEAAKIVLRDIPDVKFLIVGEGDIRIELERYAEELGIGGSVVFTGFYRNLSEVFAAIDIFVIPSLTESLPLSALEAMAAGKPVVGTDVGGIPEIIIHEETGLLVRSKDGSDMANSIIYMLHNDNFRSKIAEKGKQLIHDKFSVHNFVERTQNFYANVVGN